MQSQRRKVPRGIRVATSFSPPPLRHPQGVLPPNLPAGAEAVAAGRAIGADLTTRRSLMCETYGVASEVEYKREMVSAGRIMASMNIGMQTWADTARALEQIHAACEERGIRIDRYQMQLDRRMGLPRQFWTRAAKETGPMLQSAEDWQATSQVVPIQPHLGDMMIGSPASVDNACRALEAGVNYIGNMSQFSWKYPGWPGSDTEQVTETVKALGVMAAKVNDGAMVHSYLDDGFPAQFNDFCCYVGWAHFERYVVNELIGARLSVSYGGLSHNPVTKAAMVLALERITPEGHMNAFYHGNTTAFSRDLDQNFAALSIDDLYMMLAHRHAGGGAAILTVPITEPIRIPTWDEIVQAQTIARRVATEADRLMESINWPHLEAISEQLCAGGQVFFDNLLQGLEDLGVHIRDPLHVLLAVRRLGAPELEQRFGPGAPPGSELGPYQPRIASDTYLDFIERRDKIRNALGPRSVPGERAQTVVVGSTDVHEYALSLLVDALEHIGVAPVVAGISVDPDEFAQLAKSSNADIVLITTHNGMALHYAEQVRDELAFRGLTPTIAMGGTLNQDQEGEPAPVDVRAALQEMGVHICDNITDIAELLASAKSAKF